MGKENKKTGGKHVILGLHGVFIGPDARAGTQLQDLELPISCRAPNPALPSPPPSRKEKRGEALKLGESGREGSGDFGGGTCHEHAVQGGCKGVAMRGALFVWWKRFEAFFSSFLFFGGRTCLVEDE